MNKWFKSGTPWIWLNAGAVATSLVMVFGLILMIAVNGLSFFWPSSVAQFEYQTAQQSEPTQVMGEFQRSETMTAQAMRDAGFDVPEGQEIVVRHLVKRGNRDLDSRDFRWYLDDFMGEREMPRDAVVLERLQWGNFYGFVREFRVDGEAVATGNEARVRFEAVIPETRGLVRQIERIERVDIGAINFQIEQIRIALRGIERATELSIEERAEREAELQAERAELEEQYAELENERNELRRELRRYAILMETADGAESVIALADVVNAWWPNDMSIPQKLGHYVHTFWEFMTGYPREANTEGGILPAIFGTVLMVLIMSIVVTPFGVLAAIYLREYAKQGPLVRIIRISVNNLAGVPSIVFGVFGLGFFVYLVGGNIDQMFFRDALPSPTFGSPAIVWASLTLALLTLPVVIVSTEEGLTRIGASIRHGSLALGATKAETLWRLIVPLSAPAMMTGLILAVARAAGEVAPLMLVGVVKLAPSLPVDGNFPYLHLDRAFMHLGFHIYDVGFQSPNVEAGRPLVYATALILVMLIIVLNLTAISIRNYLREKYRADSD
ncbi:phosphate ABC transporter permease PstA [Thioalkalivibrio versutus]|uniref:phosphate ABC transporter permease PstA n=1 Tax=Thioalkalivibrio versutus TaxID=106634 RepID=UPI0003826B72|nr:phosphate ABC transporter permease PstA [Thioalkalivibrio versutus]OOC51078.1 phosphate ABC transporter, permease protein PstA [Thioalkalivibrio versutus]